MIKRYLRASVKYLKRMAAKLGIHSRDARVPTRLQFQTTECGVAALAMVLAHHGRHVSMETLRELTGASRDCVNAAEIARAARHLGLECKAYSREPEQLADLPLPFLAHLRFIHFVVVEGFTPKEVLICDPYKGRSRIPTERFAEDFTGVVLAMQPGPKFMQEAAPNHPVVSLWQRLDTTERAALAWAVAAGLAAALLLPVLAFAFASWVDAMSGSAGAALPDARSQVGTTATFALLVLLLGAMRAVEHGALSRLQTGITIGQAGHLTRWLAALPVGFFVYRLPAVLHNKIYSCETVAKLIAHHIVPPALSLLALPAGIAALFLIAPGAAMALAIFGLGCAIAIEGLYLWRGDAERSSDRASESHLNELLFGRDDLTGSKLAGKDHDFVAARLGAIASSQKNTQESGEIGALQRALGAACVVAATATVLIFVAAAATHARIGAGAATAALLIALSALLPLRGYWRLRFHWDVLLHTLLPVDDVLDSVPETGTTRQFHINPLLPDGTVMRATGLGYGYSATRAAMINDISLSLERGEQLGITGPSGGGKSTLASLLAGDRCPWTGKLEYAPATSRTASDHADANAVDASAAATSSTVLVACVDKSSFFFDGTVRENLCLWGAGVSEDRLRRALCDACMDEVIAARPGGLDSMVTERGRNFSGGQRQRLEIARALLGEPQILIFDEATDALDPALETRIRENIRQRGCSLVVVSHRASTLAACDRVLRVAGGRLVSEYDAASPESATAPAGPPTIEAADDNPAGPVESAAPELLNAAIERIAQFMGVGAMGVGAPAPQSAKPIDRGTGILALAHRHGLRARLIRFSVRTWWQRKHGPLIVFRKDSFAPLVLLPVRNGYQCIDPATGESRAIPTDVDLAREACCFHLRTGSEAENTHGILLRGLGEFRSEFVRVALLGVPFAALCVVLPMLALRLFDPATNTSLPGPVGLGVGLTALVLAAALLEYSGSIAALRAGALAERFAMSAFIQKLIRIRAEFLYRVPTEDLARGLISLQRLFERLRGEPLLQLRDAAIALAAVIALAMIDVRVAASAASLALCATLAAPLCARAGMAQEGPHERACIASSRFLFDVLSGIFRLRLLATSGPALDRWLAMHMADTARGSPVRNIDTRLHWLCGVFPWFALAALAATLNLSALGSADAIKSWQWPAAALLLWLIFDASTGLGSAAVSLLRARTQMEPSDLLATAPLEPDYVEANSAAPTIELRNIRYCYPGTSAPALNDVSLRIRPGEFIAITGPSGGGKSTLLRLLLGFDQPESGTMTLDGLPMSETDRVAMRRAAAMVSQDERVEGASTLRSQISGYASCGVTAVWRAAENVLLAEDIRRMPMGLQTIVETGKISTGQEQRLLIAREILRQPSMLILDEATNAVPDALQSALIANLRQLGLTCILVTHRESAIEHMDRVLVLDNGGIVWDGTPAELRCKKKLVDMLDAERQKGHL